MTIVFVFRFMTKYDSEINLFELRVDQQHSFNFIWGKVYLSIIIYHFIISIFNFIFGYTKRTVELIFRTVGGYFCFLTLFPLYVWFMVFKLTARIKLRQCKKKKSKNYWFWQFWQILMGVGHQPHQLFFNFGFLHCLSLIRVVILNTINHT